MQFTFGESVILHHRAEAQTRDADGNDTYLDRDSTVGGCAFAPGGSTELTQGQDLITTQPTVYVPRESLPTGVSVAAIDAVTARGVRYQVDGEPQDFRSPFTLFTPPLVIRLKNATG